MCKFGHIIMLLTQICGFLFIFYFILNKFLYIKREVLAIIYVCALVLHLNKSQHISTFPYNPLSLPLSLLISLTIYLSLISNFIFIPLKRERDNVGGGGELICILEDKELTHFWLSSDNMPSLLYFLCKYGD